MSEWITGVVMAILGLFFGVSLGADYGEFKLARELCPSFYEASVDHGQFFRDYEACRYLLDEAGDTEGSARE